MPATKLPHSKATGLLRVTKGAKNAAVRIKGFTEISVEPRAHGQAWVVMMVEMGQVDADMLMDVVRNG